MQPLDLKPSPPFVSIEVGRPAGRAAMERKAMSLWNWLNEQVGWRPSNRCAAETASYDYDTPEAKIAALPGFEEVN